MLRRLFNAVLLIVGAGPLWGALVTVSFDVHRTTALALLIAGGVALNLTGLLKRTLPVRPWLRVLAGLVLVAVLVALLGSRASTQETLDTVSVRNVPVREHLAAVVRGTTWLIAACGYVLLSLLPLPPMPADERQGGASRAAADVLESDRRV